MAQGPDDPYSRTFVGGASPPANPSYPSPQRPADEARTVPLPRFVPGPPAPPSGDIPDTFVAGRPVTPSAPAPGGYGLPPPRAPTNPPGGYNALPPAAPPQVASSLTPLYGGLPAPQAPSALPAPQAGHRRALLWLAVSTTTLAVALFAASIVLHMRRRAPDRSDTNHPARMEAPRETVGAALSPAAPTPAPAAPIAAPIAAPPAPVAAPVAPAAPTQAAPEPDTRRPRRGHDRRHTHAPIRHRRRTSTPLWGVP